MRIGQRSEEVTGLLGGRAHSCRVYLHTCEYIYYRIYSQRALRRAQDTTGAMVTGRIVEWTRAHLTEAARSERRLHGIS
jgi:hypothetical protein